VLCRLWCLAYHESTHFGDLLLRNELFAYSCHVEAVILVLTVCDNSCVELVRWLRVRGGGVVAMIAPSVQGIT
jgi:hypothetical protein